MALDHQSRDPDPGFLGTVDSCALIRMSFYRALMGIQEGGFLGGSFELRWRERGNSGKRWGK
jgi:hypothetical protein